MTCSRCRSALYCGAPCQKAHWREHKPGCAAAASSTRDENKPGYVAASASATQEQEKPGCVATAAASATAYPEPFAALGLRPELATALSELGHTAPTLLQRLALVPLSAGRDTLMQARHSSGKSTTLAAAILQRLCINENEATLQAVLLVPARELARQAQVLLTTLGSGMGVRALGCTNHGGGAAIGRDIEALRSIAPHVLAGTPERLWNMIERSALSLDGLKLLLCDDVDSMEGSIMAIFEHAPQGAQVAMTCTKLSPGVEQLASRIMHDPVWIILDEVTGSSRSRNFYVLLREEQKLEVVADLYRGAPLARCLCFCRSRERGEELVANLCAAGASAALDNAVGDDWGDRRVLATWDAAMANRRGARTFLNWDLPSLAAYAMWVYHERDGERPRVVINLVTQEDLGSMRAIEACVMLWGAGWGVQCAACTDFPFLLPSLPLHRSYGIRIDPLPGDLSSVFG